MRLPYTFRLVPLLLLPAAIPALAQLDPEAAQVFSYFPQFADGGGSGQKWVTSLTFVNAHLSLPSYGTAFLYDNDGAPLSIDFGAGPVSSFDFTVPPQGTAQFVSTGASTTATVGWAIVKSSLPLEGVVQFRFSAGGVPQQGVAAQATAASSSFRSPATASTGIAVANPSSGAINVYLSALDADGVTVANASTSLPALGHQSFNVNQIFPAISPAFRGTVVLTSDLLTTGPTEFVAWTLSAEGGVLANYPPAGLQWPVSQYERIWKIWFKVTNEIALLAASPGSFTVGALPKLVIEYSNKTINAYVLPAQNEVHIFMNLAELISDSESELGFIVAHELTHILQYQNASLLLDPNNIETDADEMGMLLALLAGYDPYGAAGALAKLSMVSGTAGLVDQNFDTIQANLGVDPHVSFNQRLDNMFNTMTAVCSLPSALAACTSYKKFVHPHLPGAAPLSRSSPEAM